jgi:protein-arginine kinase activator protein McsA
MAELKCPVCKTIMESKTTQKQVFCPNCLETKGQTIIMLESSTNGSAPRNLGGGFFEER